MDAQDLILVSVDDHVVEPPTMFLEHWPAKYVDRIPRVVVGDDGGDIWEFEGERAPNVGLNAVAGCPPEEYNLDPTEYTQMRPGCFDVHERVRDMSAAGVLAGVVPGSITGLGPAWHCSPTQPSRSPAGCRRVAPRQPGRPGSPEEIACIHAKSSELRGARAG